MAKGTLHIARNFYTTEAEGVYDVVFTPDGQEDSETQQVVRRFYGDQEVGDFLRRHLHQSKERADEVMDRLAQEKHASITGIELAPEQLRELKLAA